MLQERTQRKQEAVVKARQKIVDQVADGKATLAPNLSEQDLDFLATTRVKLSQKDILKMYVGNWGELDLKQRRKIMGYV